ncbi:tol-pal system protein YbgF [Desulfonema ishimotonii]|uniref:Tol-pal system protein YbgF n=1 Tax=Desulfonema ishimotonii TaxID=45657 RepID=A0A401G4A7_9BACT|nr:tol-pal system protein YbgF [Desulfonema ishimotonii]GBC64031.1 tol-pal system protein YbgF [Desulfonema ishimotonii]
MKKDVVIGVLIGLGCCLWVGCASQTPAAVPQPPAVASSDPAPASDGGPEAPLYQEISNEFHESVDTIVAYSGSLEARNPPARHIRPMTAEKQKMRPIARPEDIGPKILYRQALRLYEVRNFEQSREEFRRFLDVFPAHSLSDNARYWIGECYYAQQQYGEATEAFRAVLTGFNRSNKFPDAFFKVGLCYYHLRDYKKAALYWNRLIQRYPDSHAAGLARKRLAGGLS